MKETIETKALPQLVKGSSTYKLVVPEKVERKIRYLLRKFPRTEWSGVLFYKHQGSFENNDLVITCEDIYPMDLGTEGWTEFKMSEEVAAYMADNIELFDCESGLVHSHHVLGAFMSGQDMKMVQQEGEDTNCFVSLVVDTRGQYVAIITRKVQTQSEVTVKNLGKSYEFFGEGAKEISHDGTETTKTIEKEVIEYFDLEVERHEVSNDLEYLDARFEEIERRKSQINASPAFHKDSPEAIASFQEYLHGRREPKEQQLPFDNTQELTPEDEAKMNELAMGWQPNPQAIHSAVVRMVTCSFIVNAEKINFKQWIVNHMENVYKKVFGGTNSSNRYCDAFDEYKEFIIQFTMDHFNLDDAPDVMMDNYDILQSRIASAMMKELEPYMKQNAYMEEYYNALLDYVIE